MKYLAIFTVSFAILAAGFLAFSHRILPADIDECQQDVTHLGHVHELPVFHCIGHSEGNAETGWDHVHPWMTQDWHDARGLPLTGGVAPDPRDD